jgi:hypothetical protein
MIAFLTLSIPVAVTVADEYKTAKGRLCASPAQSETSALGCHGKKSGVVTETLFKDRVESGGLVIKTNQ